jgi:hypothetical protein
MHSTDNELAAPIQWQMPLFKIIKIMIAFSAITFFVGYFIYHPPVHWLLPAILLAIAYAVCFITGIYYLIKTLPVPVLMLLVPIAPLFVLIYVVSLIAFLQRFT